MQVSGDFIEGVRKRIFDRMHRSRDWWRGLTKEERKKAHAKWLALNPDDYRASWDLELVSLTHGTVEDIWALNTGEGEKA